MVRLYLPRYISNIESCDFALFLNNTLFFFLVFTMNSPFNTDSIVIDDDEEAISNSDLPVVSQLDSQSADATLNKPSSPAKNPAPLFAMRIAFAIVYFYRIVI